VTAEWSYEADIRCAGGTIAEIGPGLDIADGTADLCHARGSRLSSTPRNGARP